MYCFRKTLICIMARQKYLYIWGMKIMKYRTEIRIERVTFRDGEEEPFLRGESPLMVIHSDGPGDLLRELEKVGISLAV